MNNPAKILFKYASRSRPEKFFEGLDNIMMSLKDTENFHIACTCDADDLTMNNPQVIERIKQYPNTSITFGLSVSKIHAINRNILGYHFAILVCMSDDMRFKVWGFDDIIRKDMEREFPNYDGLLHYPDLDAKEILAVLYVAGRKWWERRNKYIYHPSYKSLWCDNEEMAVAQMMGKYVFCNYNIVDHQCPGWGRAPKDEMYLRQEKDWEADELNFNFRKSINFEVMLLSILIPTTIDRRPLFERLKEELKRQIFENGYVDTIEIKSYEDNKEISVGEKRDRLYKAANGLYSVQWDSDDWIHPQGLKLIVDALKQKPDTVTYKELCVMDGVEKYSNFSINYPDWEGEGNEVLNDGFHFHRTPFFKTPILTEYCKHIGVADLRWAEDHDFARLIKNMLHKEVHIDEFVYHYIHNSSEFNERYGIK